MPTLLTMNDPLQSDPRLLHLKKFLIDAVSPGMQDQSTGNGLDREALRRSLLDAFGNTKANLKPAIRDKVVDAALADLIGYGPLELLLPDPQINEIMVNGANPIFIERDRH